MSIKCIPADALFCRLHAFVKKGAAIVKSVDFPLPNGYL